VFKKSTISKMRMKQWEHNWFFSKTLGWFCLFSSAFFFGKTLV